MFFLSPSLVFFTVCVTPGEGELPSGVYPGCRDQQAEAHRPADSPLATDLMTHGRTKNKQRVMWKDFIQILGIEKFFCNYMFTPTKTERLWLPVTFICIRGLWFDRLLLKKNAVASCYSFALRNDSVGVNRFTVCQSVVLWVVTFNLQCGFIMYICID